MKQFQYAATLIALASLSAAIFIGRVAADDAPATQPDRVPATAPSGDWFGPANATRAKRDAGPDDEAALFAKLYPRLARADKAVRAATPRVVFDAMGSRGKPQFKLPQMLMVNEPFTQASQRRYQAGRPRDPFVQIPDERAAKIAAVDARRAGASICLDIESLPLDLRVTTKEDATRSVRLLARSIGWVRAQDPNVRLFFYGGFPTGDYYVGGQIAGLATTRPDGEAYAWWKQSAPKFEASLSAWQRANEAMVYRDDAADTSPLAALSSLFDGTCPSIYFYHQEGVSVGDIVGGATPFVRSTIDQARRYNKPVYPFVCFYMIETPQIVPLEAWVVMMREIMTHADGAVLWDGPNPWDERKTLRVRIATLMAERQGQISDGELYTALVKEFPGDEELKTMAR